MTRINISSISKAEALRRLYNGGFNDIHHPPIFGLMQRLSPELTLEEAQAAIDYATKNAPRCIYFDYFRGKALKVDLTGDYLNPRLYDRDCGPGAASRALGLPAEEDK